MFCERCGTSVSEDASFCSGCGKQLTLLPERRPQSAVVARETALDDLGVRAKGPTAARIVKAVNDRSALKGQDFSQHAIKALLAPAAVERVFARDLKAKSVRKFRASIEKLGASVAENETPKLAALTRTNMLDEGTLLLATDRKFWIGSAYSADGWEWAEVKRISKTSSLGMGPTSLVVELDFRLKMQIIDPSGDLRRLTESLDIIRRSAGRA